jgi:LmbE family N-acetylglucosaminyl deacetylase
VPPGAAPPPAGRTARGCKLHPGRGARCNQFFRLLRLLALVAIGCGEDRLCGEPTRPAVARALRRGGETIAAMRLLGLEARPGAGASDVLLLGYPNLGLSAVETAHEPVGRAASALGHTYAEDGDGDPDTCRGDLRHRLDGRHAPLTGAAFARDLDALVTLVRPTEVYTHAVFDGHPDHAVVARALDAALGRAAFGGRRRATLIHPEGTGGCMGPSAREWPNPAEWDAEPLARFTPAVDVEPPPLPPCAEGRRAGGWGDAGPPDALVEVPAAMREPSLERNLKWQVIARYASQVVCAPGDDGRPHPSCGYMRAFVKRREFFWTRRFGDGDPEAGPLLVVAAHPDDEALGFAGVIAAARAAGRRVVVAVVTNG